MTLLPAAYYLRFDFRLGPVEEMALKRSLPLLFFCCLGAGLVSGSYAVRWGHAGRVDYMRQALASGIGVLLTLALLTLATRFEQGYSRSAFLIFALLFIGAQGVARKFQDFSSFLTFHAATSHHRKPVVIYGAGRRGKLLAEASGLVPELVSYRIVAFFDEDPSLAGKKLGGLTIFSINPQAKIPRAEEVWLANPAITEAKARAMLPVHWMRLPFRRLVLELEELKT